MVKLAEPNKHTRILDAHCGSGGFLIEFFAAVMKSIPRNIKNIKENLIFEADKEEKVARLARINMYVHKVVAARYLGYKTL